MEKTPIPPLEHGSNSYVVTAPDGKVYELHTRSNIEKASVAGWKIETIGQYLARINMELKDKC